MELSDLAAEAASGLSVTDDDRRRRKEARRRRMQQQEELMKEEDPIKNLIDKGEDPDFFGFPYVWVQVAHAVLGATAVGAALVGGQGVEFALFDLPPPALAALRQGCTIVVFMNCLVAVWIFNEELQLGPERLFSALGWGLKALALGGVATWQRYGRLNKDKKKKGGMEMAGAA